VENTLTAGLISRQGFYCVERVRTTHVSRISGVGENECDHHWRFILLTSARSRLPPSRHCVVHAREYPCFPASQRPAARKERREYLPANALTLVRRGDAHIIDPQFRWLVGMNIVER
jgi:hypothetical protein